MQDINLKDVSYCYPNGFCAVDNINIEIGKGENVVIVGQNGAGKTTTVKMMNGLLKPSSGNVQRFPVMLDMYFRIRMTRFFTPQSN